VLIEIDESYAEPVSHNEKIVNAVVWHGATIKEAAQLMGCDERHILDMIAEEFKFVQRRREKLTAQLHEREDED
jgi:hypothetical protein